MTGDPLLALLALRALPRRRILGLNSGTSADGVDAAMVSLSDAGEVELERFATVPYPAGLQERLLAGPAGAAEVAALDVAIGHAFADAAEEVLGAGPRPDLVASHGQTVSHQPRSAGGVGATLQLGSAAVLAERVGAPVISNFRVRDVAAGGEGAPLVPLADLRLFGGRGLTRAVQNLGGIGNVTVVGDQPGEVIAFDTGPGNMPLDLAARLLLGAACDRDGAHAAAGRVDEDVVAQLLGDPFFALPPPRSTGRERFGAAFLAPLLSRFAGRVDDLFATLTAFVAASVHDAYARHVLPRRRLDEILLCGGGVHNRALVAALAARFAPVPVLSTAARGVDPDAKEAIAFAVLADETLHGRPGNLPAVTGAAGPRVLGTITL
jgi:anhydro-N-acetylmuramic acid kinase